MSTTRRKGATPQKAHKVEVSFTNWVMGGSLLSLSTTSSLGSRVSSKGNHKNFDVDAVRFRMSNLWPSFEGRKDGCSAC